MIRYNQMKILLTATVQSHICQFHKPLVEMLHEHGYEVHVAAHDNLAEKNGLKLDFADKVFDVSFNRSPKSMRNVKAYKQIKKIINDGDYDVIHCNTPMGGIVTRLAARKARRDGTKIIYTAHGFHFFKGASKRNWHVYYPIEKYFADKYTDVLITINSEDYRLAEEKFNCRVERIHGVGVDADRYYQVSDDDKQRLKVAMGFKPKQKIILCVGELLPNKNQAMAVRMIQSIVSEHSDIQLIIAGNGKEKENIENEIKKYNLQNNVQMIGYCTHLQDYQHISDVLVSCSRREGLPLNIVEAMLSGTPVVATGNRGHRDLIKEGKTGFLVNYNDEKAMAEKVELFLKDQTLCKLITAEAQEYAMNFSADAVKQELEEIYLQIR